MSFKLLKRLILQRIGFVLVESIAVEQAGFQPRSSTSDEDLQVSPRWMVDIMEVFLRNRCFRVHRGLSTALGEYRRMTHDRGMSSHRHDSGQVPYIPSPLEENCSKDWRSKQPAEKTCWLNLRCQDSHIKKISPCSLLFCSRVLCPSMLSLVPYTAS